MNEWENMLLSKIWVRDREVAEKTSGAWCDVGCEAVLDALRAWWRTILSWGLQKMKISANGAVLDANLAGTKGGSEFIQ